MSQPLFARLDAGELAARGSRFTDSLPVERLERLVPLLAGQHPDGEARVVSLDLRFGRDGGEVPLVEGMIEATLALVCQRCLEPVAVDIAAQLRLAVLDSEARLGMLPEGYEPLIAPEGLVRVADIVEEELLLGVPAVPMHAERRQCGALARYVDDADAAAHGEAEAERDNPFAILKNLRSN